jgi:DNA-binding NarL/FixJ family response regulator
MAVRLLLADDHEVVRIGLRTLLEADGFQVVGEAASGKDVPKLISSKKPDLVVLDIRMPDSGGLECLARIKLDHPNLPVVILTGHNNPTYMARALALGAAGYLSKSTKSQDIVAALRVAADGESIWSEEDVQQASGGLTPNMGESVLDSPLTKRERDVLKYLALGLTNKEIGATLGISYETVKEHVQHILRKLGVSDRTQAAVWAVRMNMT